MILFKFIYHLLVQPVADFFREFHRVIFFRTFFRGVPFLKKPDVTEYDLDRHFFMTARTGVGKSVVFDLFIAWYERKRRRNKKTGSGSTTVMLFEPHGDLAKDVALNRNHVDPRTIAYFDLFLNRMFTVGFNPFDQIKSKDQMEVFLYAQAYTSIFEEMISGSNLSTNMQALLNPCIATLIFMNQKGILATMNDLKIFMDDNRNRKYVDFAFQHNSNAFHQEFFRNDFYKPRFKVTKDAIAARISSLLNNISFYNLVVGPSTIDLKSLMNSRKTVIFRFTKGEMGEAAIVASKMMIAFIKTAGLQRVNIKPEHRVKVRLFIDEAPNYISKTIREILDELRKYNVGLMFAAQNVHQMEPDLRGTLLSSGVVLTGHNSYMNLQALSKEVGKNVEELQKLKIGEFYLRTTHSSKKVKFPAFNLKNRYAMWPFQWNRLVKYQLATYYRPLKLIQDKIPASESNYQSVSPVVPEDLDLTQPNAFKPLRPVIS